MRALLRRLQGQPRLCAGCRDARRYEAGARWVVLCDTNGGTLPHEVERIVAEVATGRAGRRTSGIHTHNDTDNAVANTLAAVRAGCRQIQGTLNGLGERCGNANMTSIIPTLLLKKDFAERVRDRRHAGAAAHAHAREPGARRDPERGAEPPCALCRRQRVRDQGGHSCVRDPQGSGDLRARAAGGGRQPTTPAGVEAGRPVQRHGGAGAARACASTRTIRASRRCSTR